MLRKQGKGKRSHVILPLSVSVCLRIRSEKNATEGAFNAINDRIAKHMLELFPSLVKRLVDEWIEHLCQNAFASLVYAAVRFLILGSDFT